jgi:hypothetical protein
MLKGLSLSAAAFVAFGALAVGSAAAAVPQSFPPSVLFRLEGTNGFEITGFAISEGKGEEGHLDLSVGRRGEQANYFVKGALSSSRVDFDLGGLGKLEAEIRPHAGSSTVTLGCGFGSGRSVKVPIVELVGTLEFHGEEGFTEGSAGAFVADAVPIRDSFCSVGSGEISGEGLPGTELEVDGPAGPHLVIEQRRPGARIEYEAWLEERLEDGVGVTREVYGAAPSSAFRFDKKLSHATFDPGGQLGGRAKYTSRQLPTGGRQGEGKFIGNLTANFPGRPDVTLAGPGFSAAIDHFSRSSTEGHR